MILPAIILRKDCPSWGVKNWKSETSLNTWTRLWHRDVPFLHLQYLILFYKKRGRFSQFLGISRELPLISPKKQTPYTSTHTHTHTHTYTHTYLHPHTHTHTHIQIHPHPHPHPHMPSKLWQQWRPGSTRQWRRASTKGWHTLTYKQMAYYTNAPCRGSSCTLACFECSGSTSILPKKSAPFLLMASWFVLTYLLNLTHLR